MCAHQSYTDQWGVTYSSNGRVLKEVDHDRFACEEYAVPEGVVEIEDNAFWYAQNLKRIKLPFTLRKMGCNAFIHSAIEDIELPEGIAIVPGCMCENCTELKKVTLPSSVTGIEICAFNCCRQLQEVTLPDSILFFEDGVFSGCESLKQVRLPANLQALPPELFAHSGIESIEIHNNIKEIGYWAFWDCNNLEKLVIPESVAHIGYGIVSAHEGFKGVECYAKGYHIENDALINDEKQELVCCWTQQKHYVVPECVKRIADISANDFVETITVIHPVELTTYEPFCSDLNLRRVDFQAGVSGITDGTFYNCSKIVIDNKSNK